MDLLLDSTTNDLVFVNGTSSVTQTQSEIVAQRLKIALYTFLGEWFLDTTLGTPWFQQILGKNRTQSTIDILFQTIIAADEGVIEIKDFSSTLGTDRGYTMTFTVRVSDGTTTTVTVATGA